MFVTRKRPVGSRGASDEEDDEEDEDDDDDEDEEAEAPDADEEDGPAIVLLDAVDVGGADDELGTDMTTRLSDDDG